MGHLNLGGRLYGDPGFSWRGPRFPVRAKNTIRMRRDAFDPDSSLSRDGLGQFPDRQVREHFLEQLRAHMVGGGSSGLPGPDSPRGRGGLDHHDYRGVPPPTRQPPWQTEQPDPLQQWPPNRHLYPREAEPAHPPPYPSSYWGVPHGGGVPGPGGVGSVGLVHGGGAGGVGFGHVPSSSRPEFSTSEPGRYPPPPSTSWSGVNGPIVPGHHPLDGRSLQQEPTVSGYHNMHSSPRGTDGSGGAMGGGRVGGAGEIRDGYTGPWDEGVGGGGGSVPPEHEERGGGHREPWHQSGRLSPSHLGATPRRSWGAGEPADPPERGMPQSGPASLPSIFERHGHLGRPAANFLSPGAGGGLSQQGAARVVARANRSGMVEGQNMGPGHIGGSDSGGSNSAIEPGAPREWGGAFPEPPAVSFDTRWGTSPPLDRRAPSSLPASRRADTIPAGRNDLGTPRMSARSRPDLSPPTGHSSASRFPVTPASGGTAGPRGGVSITGSPGQPNVPRDPPWPGPPRAGSHEGFGVRRYVGSTMGGNHPANDSAEVGEHGAGSRQVPSSTSISRDGMWSQQQRHPAQGCHQDQQETEGPRRTPSKAPQDSHY